MLNVIKINVVIRSVAGPIFLEKCQANDKGILVTLLEDTTTILLKMTILITLNTGELTHNDITYN